jgi:hypothetical protein
MERSQTKCVFVIHMILTRLITKNTSVLLNLKQITIAQHKFVNFGGPLRPDDWDLQVV